MAEFKGVANFVDVWSDVIMDLARKNKNIMIVDADMGKPFGSLLFRKELAKQYFDVGICEQDMLGFASGLAEAGGIPFVINFACFITQRGCDQLVNAIAYNHSNVKIIGGASGLTGTKNGGTHMSMLDISIMRSIPGMLVFEPADAVEFGKAIEYSASVQGPVYIRCARGDFPVVFDKSVEVHAGKAILMREGKDAGLITAGITTAEGIIACEELEKQGVSVRHLHLSSLKPLDAAAILETARKTRFIVTCENHNVLGGLGGAVAELLSEHHPTHIYRLGVQDKFGETADFDYLKSKYKIDSIAIQEKVLECVKR